MAIKNQLKKGEPLKVKNIIVLLVGQPDSGKTSLACSAELPLIIDTESGLHRAVNLVIPDDPICMDEFDDVREISKEDIAGYKTIVIDTIGKFIKKIEAYICKTDPKKAYNNMLLYGAIKKEFDRFNSKLLSFGCDVIYTAHAEESESNNATIIRPLLGSKHAKTEIIGDASIVGYIDFKDKKNRRLCFDADGFSLGKNFAGIPEQTVQVDINKSQLADIIKQAKDTINNTNSLRAEKKAIYLELEEKIKNCTDIEHFNLLFDEVKENGDQLLKTILMSRSKELNFEYDKESKSFIQSNPAIATKSTDKINI